MLRRLFLLVATSLVTCLVLSRASVQGASPSRTYLPLVASPAQNPLIAALLYDGIITGEPDEAFQLYNPNDFVVSLAGWQVRSGSRIATFPSTFSLAAAQRPLVRSRGGGIPALLRPPA